MAVLKTHQAKNQRVDRGFLDNLKKLHPDKSCREATKELNKILQEMLYGRPKKNKK